MCFACQSSPVGGQIRQLTVGDIVSVVLDDGSKLTNQIVIDVARYSALLQNGTPISGLNVASIEKVGHDNNFALTDGDRATIVRVEAECRQSHKAEMARLLAELGDDEVIVID